MPEIDEQQEHTTVREHDEGTQDANPNEPERSSRPHNSTFGHRVHNVIKEIQPWGILLATVALSLSLLQFWLEHGDRVEARHVRAWQVVTTKAPGNSGKIAALEYLNKLDGLFCFQWLEGTLTWLHGDKGKDVGCVILMKPRTPLVGLDFSYSSEDLSKERPSSPGVYLQNINLDNAILTDSQLPNANLAGSSLKKAILTNADLEGANLRNANLFHANLTGTILRGADLTEAKLSGTTLRAAKLDRTALGNL